MKTPQLVGIGVAVVSLWTSAALAQRAQVLVSGLRKPVDFAPDPTVKDRFYIVEQVGTIRIVENGQLRPEPFFEVDRANFTDRGWEQGLLGLAFDPSYSQNQRLYINYTNAKGDTHVARIVATDPYKADQASEQLILAIDQPWDNHNGGCIRFGPDGMLYIGMGDGGAANDPKGSGQDRRSLLGKMLRIDVTSQPAQGMAYAIPGDNPFIHLDDTLPEIWALGVRNPWKFSFDSKGRMWIGDVGQNTCEWVHVQPEGSKGGENYGWNAMEGPNPFSARPAAQRDIQPDPATLVSPVWSYTHRSNNGANGSITGGYFYEGAKIPSLRNRYIVADFMSGRVWSFKLGGNGKADDIVEHTDAFAPAFKESGRDLTISSFGRDLDGELYMLDLKAGTLIQIVP